MSYGKSRFSNVSLLDTNNRRCPSNQVFVIEMVCLSILVCAAIWSLLLATGVSPAPSQRRLNLLIDVDVGIDDAEALIVAFASSSADVVAVTTVEGNVEIEHVAENTVRVLRTLHRMNVPLYVGAAKPILGYRSIPQDYYFGRDGFGDFEGFEPINYTEFVQPKHAANAIVDIVNKRPGEIRIVALGSLTNIVLAARLDPTLFSKLDGIYIMGGNLIGTTEREFNFAVDPEASFATIHEPAIEEQRTRSPVPSVTLFPFDTCMMFNFTWAQRDEWLSTGTEQAALIRNASLHVVDEKHKNGTYSHVDYATCDPMTVIVATNPDAVTSFHVRNVTVDLVTSSSRGRVIEPTPPFGGTLVRFVDAVDMKIMFETMVRSFGKNFGNSV